MFWLDPCLKQSSMERLGHEMISVASLTIYADSRVRLLSDVQRLLVN